jgi:anaerobic ribonucleoside-triphosphate reductase
MSASQRVRGARVLKAVASPLRLQILNLLFDKGLLSYTELMSSLKMNPGRDAGRFAYHLKFLLKADLVEVDAEARKYCLTEMGKMVIDVADKIDRKALKSKSTLVRTSRLALEEFDANKIANSLIREAKMPAELAQKIAKEAEKQLLRSKTKYLTAPLVREVVNAILIEDGLEDYRNKLTRLGVPVHDVTSLLESRSREIHNSISVAELTGRAVFKEYTLLHVFPRDISDAHLSGALHIDNLSSWITKPKEVMHDLRFFMENGLNLENTNSTLRSYPPPQDLETALDMIFNALLYAREEIGDLQTVDYFNIFLAPFATDVQPSRIRQLLSLFVLNLNRHTSVSLGLELTIPGFLEGKPALGFQGKRVGKYKDFEDQAQMLASLLIDIMIEQNANKPMNEPTLIVKMRSNAVDDERANALLLKAHKLASETGLVSFANALKKEDVHNVFSSSGFRLVQDTDGDWETDTLRTGLLGAVTINIPRLVHETGKDKTRLTEILKERIEMANRALDIKYVALKNRAENLLPFLMQGGNGDRYFRIENCSRIINIAGLREAVETFSERSITDEKSLSFASEVAQDVSTSIRKIGKRRGKHLSPALLLNGEAAERLAQADIERYGIAKVKFSGTREKPFYSTTCRSSFNAAKLSEENLILDNKTNELHEGGGLTIIGLGDAKYEPSDLATISKQLFDSHNVRFFAYERKLTYCTNCKKSWFGLLRKCPVCGAIGTLVLSNRFSGT